LLQREEFTMPDVNVTSADRLTRKQVGANVRFANACDTLAEAEDAYRREETHENEIVLLAARMTFAAAKADHGEGRQALRLPVPHLPAALAGSAI
jgi:hypothetical protein